MKKFLKEYWMHILIIVVFLILISFFLIRMHIEKLKTVVLYEGGNFRIVSNNDAVYIINDDIYGGIHELKSNQSCGENKTSRTE